MPKPEELLSRNRAWAKALKEQDPKYFTRLAQQPSPEYLWIGCSDCRLAENQIVSMLPGGVVVHRNVANMVMHYK